jgi:hypothetical protein
MLRLRNQPLKLHLLRQHHSTTPRRYRVSITASIPLTPWHERWSTSCDVKRDSTFIPPLSPGRAATSTSPSRELATSFTNTVILHCSTAVLQCGTANLPEQEGGAEAVDEGRPSITARRIHRHIIPAVEKVSVTADIAVGIEAEAGTPNCAEDTSLRHYRRTRVGRQRSRVFTFRQLLCIAPLSSTVRSQPPRLFVDPTWLLPWVGCTTPICRIPSNT